MTNTVYDDQDTDDQYSPDQLLEAENQDYDTAVGTNDNQETKSANDLLGAEKDATKNESPAKDINDVVGKGFTGATPVGGAAGVVLKVGNFFLGSKKRKTGTGIATVVLIATTLLGGGFFSFLNVFKLDHFVSNIEAKAFMRYQVDMDHRSSKWIQAYITMRFADVTDADGNYKDNVFFRSNRVDTNSPTSDWYRTLRTSKFEKDVFNKHGIRFTSAAVTDAQGHITFRPAQLTFSDSPSDNVILSNAEMDSIFGSDRSKFNSDILDKKISSTVFEGDKDARKAIREAVNKEIPIWQWTKRRHIRKDIQNMTGVRNWRFFETTRNKIDEKKINMRNAFIKAALPESTKSGKFVQCIFGITNCKSSSDIANPENRNTVPTPDGTNKEGNTTSTQDGSTKYEIDENGAASNLVGDITDDLAEETSEELSKNLTQKIVAKTLSKFSGATSVLDVLESLSRIDKSITNGSLVNMVSVARGTQAAGFFTTLAIARDQLKTGEVNGAQLNDFMNMANSVGNNEAWTSAVDPLSSTKVSAASTTNTNSSTSCEEKNLQKATDADFAYLCPEFKIGGDSAAGDLTNFWVNSAFGQTIHAVLSAYRNSIGAIWGPISDSIGAVISGITGPAVSALLSLTGLQGSVNDATAWLIGIVSQKLGAGPIVTNTTGPLVGLVSAEGAAYTNESSMRYQGAASTTNLTRAQTESRVVAYLDNQDSSQNLLYRYASLSNPSSFLSNELFAVTSSNSFLSPRNFLTSIFSTVTNLPNQLSSTVSAATTSQTGYELSKFSGIQTYDFPNQCMESNPITMTPADSTNADEEGLIPANELTWDLVNNKEAFYTRLYQSNPTDTQTLKIYNCALLDTTTRGSIGAQYGYENDNSIYSQPAPSTPAGPNPTGSVPTGSAQELAKQILANPNISFQSRNGWESFQQVANTGMQTGPCSTVPIDTRLLGLLLTASQNYKIVLGVFNAGHGCTGFEHQKGRAVDMNGINRIDGSGGTGNHITAGDFNNNPIVKEFYVYMAGLMSSNGGGELGQIQCFSSKPQAPTGVRFFTDSCNHLHMDTGN